MIQHFVQGICEFSELDFYVVPTLLLCAADPLADSSRPEDIDDSTDYVHVRIQQRNGKKSLTTIQVRGDRRCPGLLLCLCSANMMHELSSQNT